MTVDTVDTKVLRRFNRNYTQLVGALEDSFLGLGLPLGSARLLFEIGYRPDPVQALRTRLGIDSGYLSRLLRSLEEKGYITVQPDPADRRRRLVALTDHGRTMWTELERRSEARAHLILDPLTERQRTRLNEALATADLLVRAATVAIEQIEPGAPAAREAVGRYFAELDQRFEEGFDPGSGDPFDDHTLRPPTGLFLVAVSDGEPVACGGVRGYDGTAEIKRMWVHDAWRGAGLGSRLLRRLETEAVRLGHSVVRLDTRHVLSEAIALYERSGYQPIPQYNPENAYATRWFSKELDVPVAD